jgi:hypothetical protein
VRTCGQDCPLDDSNSYLERNDQCKDDIVDRAKLEVSEGAGNNCGWGCLDSNWLGVYKSWPG